MHRLVVGTVELLNSSPFSPSSSILDSSIDVVVIVRRLMFCAFANFWIRLSLLPRRPFLNRLPSNFAVVSATARLPSICELLLLAATVAAFIARLFLGSESGGIGMSCN